MKRLLCTLILAFTSSVSWSQNAQISLNKTFTRMHVYSDKASFTYAPAHSDGSGCTGSGAAYTVTISWAENEDYKAMYSAALAAYMSGKKVGFGVNGCISAFGGDTPLLYRLDVE